MLFRTCLNRRWEAFLNWSTQAKDEVEERMCLLNNVFGKKKIITAFNKLLGLLLKHTGRWIQKGGVSLHL